MIKQLPLLSLPLAGAALLVALSGPDQSEAPAPAPEPDTELRDELVALKARMKTLEGDADLLRARIRVLESRPGGTATGGGTTAAAPVQAGAVPNDGPLRELIEEPAAGGARTQLKEMVRSVQDELREEQRRQRFERMQETERQAQAASQARWRKFVTDQRLDYRQEQALTSRLELERSRSEQLFQEVRDGRKSMRDVRAELRSLRTTTDQELKSVLSEEQHQTYLNERRNEQRRPRGERGGGSGGREGARGERGDGQRTRQR